MKGFIRSLLPAGLALCALAGTASAQTRAHAIVRHTAMGTRILCNDGTWGYVNRGNCVDHDGVAVRQPTYATNPRYSTNETLTPREAARARARANYHAALAGTNYYSTIRRHATARCNDGTYYHSTRHRGACEAHGGVATWFY